MARQEGLWHGPDAASSDSTTCRQSGKCDDEVWQLRWPLCPCLRATSDRPPPSKSFNSPLHSGGAADLPPAVQRGALLLLLRLFRYLNTGTHAVDVIMYICMYDLLTDGHVTSSPTACTGRTGTTPHVHIPSIYHRRPHGSSAVISGYCRCRSKPIVKGLAYVSSPSFAAALPYRFTRVMW
ncbi:hypothetical protein P280DRAFT_285324 [Massarina eburnea CBS 473.64]|uniref:Uncharacterized protein n=1 Tax=Massarina eburnea CBS 473.64 TaxID=1395130 RepID=A0A6A6S3V1_9PLEO|nr:hypothetical protein P280DRAFT_285324 [Massarina eburnea CBS 473.64]